MTVNYIALSKNEPKHTSQQSFNQVSFIEVGEEEAGQRLDNFLIKNLKGVPKSRIYRMMRKGEVRVNKGRVKPTSRLEKGDVVRIPPIRISEQKSPAVPGQQLRKYLQDNILFEDEAMLVLNKPSGLAVHGGSGISMGVIEALRAERPKEKFLELVHRLDRETSGCLMLAKKRSALISLQEQMKKGLIEKHYLTLVKGKWPKGKRTVNAPLKKSLLTSGERIVRVDVEGKNAVTHFKIRSTLASSTLLEVALETGRTHQIRVHCQFSGHPLAGDDKYGDDVFNKELKGSGLNRLFLHACYLRFKHPISGDWVEVEAETPSDLLSVLSALT